MCRVGVEFIVNPSLSFKQLSPKHPVHPFTGCFSTHSIRRAGSSILPSVPLRAVKQPRDNTAVTLFVWPFTWQEETGRRCSSVFVKITQIPPILAARVSEKAQTLQKIKFQPRCGNVNNLFVCISAYGWYWTAINHTVFKYCHCLLNKKNKQKKENLVLFICISRIYKLEMQNTEHATIPYKTWRV